MYRHKLMEAKSIISSMISSLEKILFDKSIKTEKHTERIKEMALELGKSIKLPPNEIDELSLLATIHDIEKVAILDVILNKKENLSKKEAIVELEKCSGTQFDPQLVKKFIGILKSNSKY